MQRRKTRLFFFFFVASETNSLRQLQTVTLVLGMRKKAAPPFLFNTHTHTLSFLIQNTKELYTLTHSHNTSVTQRNTMSTRDFTIKTNVLKRLVVCWKHRHHPAAALTKRWIFMERNKACSQKGITKSYFSQSLNSVTYSPNANANTNTNNHVLFTPTPFLPAKLK